MSVAREEKAMRCQRVSGHFGSSTTIARSMDIADDQTLDVVRELIYYVDVSDELDESIQAGL